MLGQLKDIKTNYNLQMDNIESNEIVQTSDRSLEVPAQAPAQENAIDCTETISYSNSNAYSHAIELLKYEGEMLWVILSACMVVNVLLVGFIAQVVSDPEYVYSDGSVRCEIGAVIGIFLSFAWYGTFLRNSSYYHFRMEQAKGYEDFAYPLLNNPGEDFANGKEVTVNGKKIRLGVFARVMKNKFAGHILIWSFIVIYSIVILHCWPYSKTKKAAPQVKVELTHIIKLKD